MKWSPASCQCLAVVRMLNGARNRVNAKEKSKLKPSDFMLYS